MARSLGGVAILAGLLLWQATAARAEENLSFSSPTWIARIDAGLQPIELRTFRGDSPAGVAPVAGPPADRGRDAEGRPFPENVQPQREAADIAQLFDRRNAASRGESSGTVCGRLLDRGRPLVNCHVVIVPMHEEQGVCRFDPDRQILDTTTDENGEYRFANVPRGDYKLTWLPAGQTRWIRRIAMRPDVKVRSGETTKLKEIRLAMQTIN